MLFVGDVMELSCDGLTTIHNMRVFIHLRYQSYALLMVVTLLSSLSSFAQTITGTVFRDFNSDGLYTPVPASGTYAYGEPGVSGITVTAYNAAGSQVSTTTSTTSGTYSLTGLTANQSYRVEFTNLQAGDYEGFKTSAAGGNATSVQFVNAGATNVNFGINYPNDYCQPNPNLTVPCYVSGDPLSATTTVGNEHVLINISYPSTGTVVSTTALANASQVGSVWGVAYQRESQKVFSAAFLKRHVGLGSAGLGGIYVTNMVGAPATSLYVDLENAPFNFDLGASKIAGRFLPGSGTTSSTDIQSFSSIGTVGLGGLALSTNGTILYAVDLYNKRLIALTIGNPANTTLTAANSTTIAIPDPGCPNGAARPFAVTVQNNKVYVGVVCSGENNGSSNDLHAYIYAMAEGATSFSTTSILNFSLNYPKGSVRVGDNALGSAWETWATNFSQIHIGAAIAAGTRVARPQPMLSDISFADNGDMILGFADRGGHQLGYKQRNTTDEANPATTLYNGYIGGDILRAHYDGTNWVLEKNATVGNLTSSGKGNNQGPGTLTGTPPNTTYTAPFGEFYFTENYAENNADLHQETAMGGVMSVHGLNQTVATVMDPINVFTGGLTWFNNTTGDDDRRAQIYATTTANAVTLGKASGLGTVKALCNPAPIQIGNRVWRDDNNNGVQDAGEPGIGGVRVTLAGAGLANPISVTTNGAGEYYFTNLTSATTATGFAYNLSLTRNGSYTLSFPTSYSTYALSAKSNSATGANADNIDTDADAAGVVAFALGQSGANNYSYDIGYVACTPPTVAFTASSSAICQGQAVTLSTVANPTGTYSYSISAPTGVTLSAANSATATATGMAAGINTFTVTVGTGPTCFTTATVSVNVSAAPALSLAATQTAICTGQSLTITASGAPTGSSYSIGVLGGLGSAYSTSNTFPVSPTATTTYSVTAIAPGGTGCFATAQLSVTVNNTPVLAPVSVSLCAAVGTPVNLSTILTSNENTTALAGLTNTFAGTSGPVANPTAVNLVAGINSFSVISTGVGGCTASTPLTVALTAAPTLNVVITAVTCNSATNQYTVSGTVSLTTTQASALTITDGSVSTTIAVDNSTPSVPFTLPAQASGTSNHVVVASLPSCTTANVTSNAPYTAPTSCSVAAPQLTLNKLVSNSVANVGSVLTYTLVVSNVGSAAASNVIVTDSVSLGLRFVANSATAPQGTTFAQGNPISTWTVGTLGIGQSVSMTFQVIADSAGVLYNKARIPNTAVTVCTSIPYHVCVGDNYLFTLTAPAGRSNYRWYRTADGVTTQLTSFTTNVLDVTAAGSYSLAVDNATGACQDFTCCPFVVIEDALPTFSARTAAATCNGSTAQANGQLILSGFQAGNTFQYSLGNTFNATASLSGAAQPIPTTGIIATNLANPATPQTYTVRVYNATGCYTDVMVTLATTTCNCPPTVCTPFVFKQSKGVARIENRR